MSAAGYAALRELPGFPRWLPTGMLVRVEGESPEHHDTSYEILGRITE